MASIGFGYNKSGVQYNARDYAISLNKSVKSKDSLSRSWFYDFLKRWPDLENLQCIESSVGQKKIRTIISRSWALF